MNKNNKMVFLLIAVAVIVIGGFLLLNKSNTQTPGQQSQSQPTGQPANQPSAQEAVIQRSEVAVTASGFDPQTLTIKAGTSVIWTNTSGSPVTVNSAVHPTHLLYPFLNLGEFADGSAVSVVVEKPGTYNYHNHLNPSQTGTIIAQ